MEVPFIWAYRRDYLHPEVDCDLLWYIYDLDQKWEALRKQRERLLQEIETIRDAAEGISDDDVGFTFVLLALLYLNLS